VCVEIGKCDIKGTSPEFMSSISLQVLIDSLRTLGVNYIVRKRKGDHAVVYQGATNIISDSSEAQRKTTKYKVELDEGSYDGEVQCIMDDDGNITEVEITGYGTMHYKNGDIYTDIYTGNFWRGFRHGQGTMEFLGRQRTYTGEWCRGIAGKTGVLHFKGRACNYEGQIEDMAMNGNGIFERESPHYTFRGVFRRDVPVSGALKENKTIGPKTMKTIEAVSILQQKPYELDAQTKENYDRELQEQTKKDIEEQSPVRPNSPPKPYGYSPYV
jgi:hypothetical protein